MNDMLPIRPYVQGSWRGEWCNRCDRRNNAAFRVDGSVWDAVVRDRWNVVCPACFDEEAEAAGIEYQFIDAALIAWSDWTTA